MERNARRKRQMTSKNLSQEEKSHRPHRTLHAFCPILELRPPTRPGYRACNHGELDMKGTTE
jgi:hypothetical protein